MTLFSDETLATAGWYAKVSLSPLLALVFIGLVLKFRPPHAVMLSPNPTTSQIVAGLVSFVVLLLVLAQLEVLRAEYKDTKFLLSRPTLRFFSSSVALVVLVLLFIDWFGYVTEN